MNRKVGFTLVELLIYTTIFAVVAIALAYILTVFLRISGQQIASSEVSNQANFILQRIQGYVCSVQSPLIVVNDNGDDETDAPLGNPYKYLVIKHSQETTADSGDIKSPILIYQDGFNAIFKQGNQTAIRLNTDKVLVDALTFTKVSTPPGRDTVQVNLVLRYNSPNPAQQISRQFLLGIGRASAATFDTVLEPGADNTLDIGAGSKRWKDLFLQGDLDVAGKAKLGVHSTAVGFFKKGSVSIDPLSIAGGDTYTANITAVSGAVSGDQVFVTAPHNLEAGLLLKGARAVTDGLEIVIYNSGSGATNGAAKNWHYLILR